ncbi:hypothetical protein F5Y18DRAFT_113324 [Xylariaceae sp. FL1019]|nr:hypothetical protein F5Y18DRAFT_113324 [Xylariaceae sp. FL1019]
MGKSKKKEKKVPAPTHGVAAAGRRARFERAQQYDDAVWRNLNALNSVPKLKHKSYFEVVDNEDKKSKKLEYKITKSQTPLPAFEFIPTGYPELSTECKELSRDREAMYFIVSSHLDPKELDHHMNRQGYHFRQVIVDDARKTLTEQGLDGQYLYPPRPGAPEPIPKSQLEINLQADAVLRDLFPRIPHTNRRQIIEYAFKKNNKYVNGQIKVGMAEEVTLARRVQLATLAHIRHTLTRYDKLLRESDWPNARKAVEKPCLDIIIKWRGDEETGRDQLDEILREVIEISDTEGESDDESSSDADVSRPQTTRNSAGPLIADGSALSLGQPPTPQNVALLSNITNSAPHTPLRARKLTKSEKKAARQKQKRFRRYALAAEAFAKTSDPLGDNLANMTLTSPNRATGAPDPAPVVGPDTISRSSTVLLPGKEKFQPGKENIKAYRDADTSLPRPTGHETFHYPSDSIHRDLTSEIIRIPDAQRPKVGPYSAASIRAPPPRLKPVSLGLQDMLVQSIEPRTPNGNLSLHKRVHSDTQQLADNSHMVTRTMAETTRSTFRLPELRPTVPEGDFSKRPHTTFFPEDYAELQGRDAQTYRPIPVTREYPTHQGTAPSGGDTNGQLRRVVVREYPSQETLAREVSPQRRYVVHGTRPESARIRDYPITSDRMNYSHSRYHPGLSLYDDISSRPLTYHEVRSHHSSTHSSLPTIRRVVESSSQYPASREPELVHVVDAAPGRSNITYRQSEMVSADSSRFQSYTDAEPREYRQHQEFYVVRSTAPNDSRGNVVIQETRPQGHTPTGGEHYRSGPKPDFHVPPQVLEETPTTSGHYAPFRMPVGTSMTPGHYVPIQQPFPIHPAPSSHVEIRGPSTNERMLRDYRDVVYPAN